MISIFLTSFTYWGCVCKRGLRPSPRTTVNSKRDTGVLCVNKPRVLFAVIAISFRPFFSTFVAEVVTRLENLLTVNACIREVSIMKVTGLTFNSEICATRETTGWDKMHIYNQEKALYSNFHFPSAPTYQ